MVEAALRGSGNIVFIAAAAIEEKIRKSACAAGAVSQDSY
jgi:hypothetical protein